jgi:hypothetical protein
MNFKDYLAPPDYTLYLLTASGSTSAHYSTDRPASDPGEIARWEVYFDERADEPLRKYAYSIGVGQKVRLRVAENGSYHERWVDLEATIRISSEYYEEFLSPIELLTGNRDNYAKDDRTYKKGLDYQIVFISMEDLVRRAKFAMENRHKPHSAVPGENPEQYWRRLANPPGKPPQGRMNWQGD